MKILLVKPKLRVDNILPVLGLGYLANAIKDKHEVKILDCMKEDFSLDDYTHYLKDYKPDVVGIQCFTYDIYIVADYLKQTRRILPDAITMIGGPHPTAMPAESMGFFGITLDYAFRSEAEEGLPELLKLIASKSVVNDNLSKVKNLIWRNGNQIVANPVTYIADVGKLGMPAWELMPPDTYPKSPFSAFYKRFPVAPIITSRGCPYKCTYCQASLISGKRMRYRPVSLVVEEIRYLQEKFGVKEFQIIDDNFTLNRKYVMDFCNAIIKDHIDITWTCPNGVRLDTLNDEMIEAMKSSGCYIISAGIESGSDRILKYVKKHETTDIMMKSVRMIQKHGIDVVGFFILGFPTETAKEMQQTIRFSEDLGLLRANFLLFHPIPGTEIYTMLNHTGELANINYDANSFAEVAYTPKGMTKDKLKNIQRKAFLSFYLRPKQFISLMSNIRSYNHLSYILRRVYRWLIKWK
ncbi:MAG: B12-binding domain-containing radical SAM protein [Deltaproteobacteria bacterium]|nr:B12-binding domain-containing radical SAM protein [Deltaproteobacteria bacterium]